MKYKYRYSDRDERDRERASLELALKSHSIKAKHSKWWLGWSIGLGDSLYPDTECLVRGAWVPVEGTFNSL